jgi:hypothetical protein
LTKHVLIGFVLPIRRERSSALGYRAMISAPA